MKPVAQLVILYTMSLCWPSLSSAWILSHSRFSTRTVTCDKCSWVRVWRFYSRFALQLSFFTRAFAERAAVVDGCQFPHISTNLIWSIYGENVRHRKLHHHSTNPIAHQPTTRCSLLLSFLFMEGGTTDCKLLRLERRS